LIFAHLTRAATAIFLRAAADMVRLTGAEPVEVANATTGCDSFRILAHLAFCACAIFRREAADMIRFCCAILLGAAPVPLNDSIPEIIWSNLSTSACARLRFSRSSRSAFSKFDIVFPSGILIATQIV
jgi:hypothetical protein